MKTTIPIQEKNLHAGSNLARVTWAIADAWTITRRDLLHWQLQPGSVIMGWLFPVMIVLMFGLFFGGAIKVPENGSYFEFLMAGMFATTMLFNLENTFIAVTTDISKGVTDRFRSMPMSASAVVLGRCIADMLNSLVGLFIMVIAGLLLGWRWHAGLNAMLAAIGLLLLMRFALLWVGIFLALVSKSPQTVTSIQILVWPVSFLSNVFIDPATMPAWLGFVAAWNPLSITTSAARQLFLNPGWQASIWISENAIPMAFIWPLVIAAIFIPLCVHKYSRLNQ
jgi:ABC-2 type transport system permease protein